MLLQPSEHLGAVPPDSDATFELFDRVVNVKLNAAVPFGLRGTVAGIHQGICTCINFRRLHFPLQISNCSENGQETLFLKVREKSGMEFYFQSGKIDILKGQGKLK